MASSEEEKTPESPPVGTEEQPKTFDAEYVEKLRKESAKYRTEAKANAEAAQRLAELEQAQMSEVDKAAARIKAAEDRAAALEADNNRKDVALEFRLSSDDAALLEGIRDVESMRRIAERLAAQDEASRAPRPPKPNPAQHGADAPVDDKDATARAFFGIT